jgi:hypothetical protein
MIHDPSLAAIYQRNAESLGHQFRDGKYERAAISTDMGNLSLTIPAIHPMISIDSLPAVNHQPEFTVHCAREAADKAVVDGALALALTAIDAAQDAVTRDRLLLEGEARTSVRLETNAVPGQAPH